MFILILKFHLQNWSLFFNILDKQYNWHYSGLLITEKVKKTKLGCQKMIDHLTEVCSRSSFSIQVIALDVVTTKFDLQSARKKVVARLVNEDSKDNIFK